METNSQVSINKRYDFVYLFDVTDGNPNGDPDAANLPRVDPENGQGLVSDVCLKRKVRNYIEIKKANNDRFKIFIQEKAVLNDRIEEGYDEANSKDSKSEKSKDKTEDRARVQMCKKYYDVRTFGAVMTTGKGDGDKTKKTAGQVRGAVQLTFARSFDPIVSNEHTITRMAVTKKEDENKERTMGRKSTVPYGLYKCHGFVTPHFAQDTGFTQEDLDLFWEALKNMFDVDHSAARGLMSARRIIVFEHESSLGNAPAFELFDRIKVTRKSDVEVARKFDDYSIIIETENLPENVKVYDLVTGWNL